MNDYDVKFTGVFYNLLTAVTADTEEQAKEFALLRFADYYGWDLNDTYFEVQVIKRGEYT